MSDILLEKNGIENTNIDGARFNRFCAGYRDGIIKGAYDECALSLSASNVIAMSKGELLLSGFRVISEAKTFEYTSFPSSAIRYQIIAQLDLSSENVPSFSCFVQNATNNLTKDDFFGNTATGGTYQVELARFTLTSSGIEDLVQTVDVIKGSSSSSISSLTIGEVVTEKIDYTLDAEVDVDENIDDDGNVTIDFKFSLPIDMTEVVTTVETAAANAEASATKAQSSASEALASATSALTAATNAETSAAAALVSATNAEESAASAQTSASNAESSASSAQESANTAVTTANNALEITSSFETAIESKADTSDIPTSTSQLTNDSGYITKAVSDLTNYYLKSETYTQEEINGMVSAIPKFSIQVVDELPTSDISETTVYLVKDNTITGNLYTEYIYVNKAWEVLGSQEVDLTGCVTHTPNTAVGSDGQPVYVASDGTATVCGNIYAGNYVKIGSGATANAEFGIALGYTAKATNRYGTAVGFSSSVNYNSVGLGAETVSNSTNSISIGARANYSTTDLGGSANYDGEIAIGAGSAAVGTAAIAIGSCCENESAYHLPDLETRTIAAADHALAIGYNANTKSESAIAIGNGSTVSGAYSTAIGNSATVGSSTIPVMYAIQLGQGVNMTTGVESTRPSLQVGDYLLFTATSPSGSNVGNIDYDPENDTFTI